MNITIEEVILIILTFRDTDPALIDNIVAAIREKEKEG